MKDTIDDFIADAVVVDAGDFPSGPEALYWLDHTERIVCCDGAADALISAGLTPWRIVGDCDSLSQEIRRRFSSIVRHIPEQESNDQTKAVRYLAARGFTRIVIVGATGRREDHTLGNISLLMEYRKIGIDARIYTDYGVFIPCGGHSEFTCRQGSQVSVFNFGASGMRSQGLRYPLRDFNALWQGTLNEVITPRFIIDAEGEYLVYINYPK